MPPTSRIFWPAISVVFLAVLWLGCSCSASADTTEARRKEGTQLLAAARDALRNSRDKQKVQPASVSDAEPMSHFAGEYFSVLDGVYPGQWPAHTDAPMFRDGPTAIVAKPKNPADGWGVMYFDWTTGRSIIEWIDTEPAFMKPTKQ